MSLQAFRKLHSKLFQYNISSFLRKIYGHAVVTSSVSYFHAFESLSNFFFSYYWDNASCACTLSSFPWSNIAGIQPVAEYLSYLSSVVRVVPLLTSECVHPAFAHGWLSLCCFQIGGMCKDSVSEVFSGQAFCIQYGVRQMWFANNSVVVGKIGNIQDVTICRWSVDVLEASCTEISPRLNLF